MMRDTHYGWYRPPLLPANGIRAQTRSGQFGKTWWAGKWIAALERLVDSARLGRGRSYARSGQVLGLTIEPGRVLSRVQGSRPTPYTVRIEIQPLSGADWEKVADTMSAQAIFAAKLLAGEMPTDIEDAFSAAGVSLFPAAHGDLRTECSCPDWANPCKHVAAVYYLLGEQFDADPFLLFHLRGKSREEIMTMLRARRTAPSAEQQPIPESPFQGPEAQAPEQSPALGDLLDRFWESPTDLDDVAITVERPSVDAVPVKRLGKPGFWQASGDILHMFGNLYGSVSDECLEEMGLGEATMARRERTQAARRRIS